MSLINFADFSHDKKTIEQYLHLNFNIFCHCQHITMETTATQDQAIWPTTVKKQINNLPREHCYKHAAYSW